MRDFSEICVFALWNAWMNFDYYFIVYFSASRLMRFFFHFPLCFSSDFAGIRCSKHQKGEWRGSRSGACRNWQARRHFA